MKSQASSALPALTGVFLAMTAWLRQLNGLALVLNMAIALIGIILSIVLQARLNNSLGQEVSLLQGLSPRVRTVYLVLFVVSAAAAATLQAPVYAMGALVASLLALPVGLRAYVSRRSDGRA